MCIAVETGFDFLSDDYRGLFARSDATAFQHPVWLDAFYRLLAPARGAEALVVTGRDEAGRLRFLLPLIRRSMSGVALVESADLGVGDYSAPVADRDHAGDASLVEAVAEAIGRCDILRIKPVRDEHLAAWRRFVGADERVLDFSAHAATPALPYAAWRKAHLDKSFQKYLDRRKTRFLKSGRVVLDLLDQAVDIRQSIDAIRALRAGRFEGDPIQTDFVRDFYATVAVDGASEGFSRTYRLSHDGEAVGHVFGLTHAGRFHYLLIGCDYERWGRHSPGLVFYDLMMEDWAAAGGTVFDFTIGDEAFKADFATTPTAMTRFQAGLTMKGRLALLASDARDQLKALAARKER